MDNSKTNSPDDLAKFEVSDDLTLFFDNFIKQGETIMEKEVAPGLIVKLRVLGTGELLSAETVLYDVGNIPADIVAKVRGASILSQALISLNGIPVERPEMDAESIRIRRHALYQQLLKMPAIIVQKSYALYVDAFKAQNAIYENIGETTDKIKNF